MLFGKGWHGPGGIGGHRRRILVPTHRGQIDAAITAAVACGNRGDDDPAAGTLGQEVGLPVQQLQDAGTDGTETSDGDLQRRFHDGNPNAVCETREPLRGGATHAFVAPES
jgi:hypothetical protein